MINTALVYSVASLAAGTSLRSRLAVFAFPSPSLPGDLWVRPKIEITSPLV